MHTPYISGASPYISGWFGLRIGLVDLTNREAGVSLHIGTVGAQRIGCQGKPMKTGAKLPFGGGGLRPSLTFRVIAQAGAPV